MQRLTSLFFLAFLFPHSTELSYGNEFKLPTNSTETKVTTIQHLVQAMIQVESEGNESIHGDLHLKDGSSVGVLQIRPIMVREVNRILKLQKKKRRYTLKDRYNREKSIEIFNIWMNFHHPQDSFEIIARNWNGGPKGYKKQSTKHYWNKVKRELNKI